MQGRVGHALVALSTVKRTSQRRNPATHGMKGNALTPALYTALELSNKTWRLALSNGAKGRHGIPDRGMLSCLNGVS